MDSLTSFTLVIAFIVVVIVGAFLYECGRRIYYWSAARIYGWSKQERFMRETAWLDRAVARDQLQGQRDAAAAGNTERRRIGILLVSIAIAAVAWQLNLLWWEIALIVGCVYAGLTMAAGLAWKW